MVKTLEVESAPCKCPLHAGHRKCAFNICQLIFFSLFFFFIFYVLTLLFISKIVLKWIKLWELNPPHRPCKCPLHKPQKKTSICNFTPVCWVKWKIYQFLWFYNLNICINKFNRWDRISFYFEKGVFCCKSQFGIVKCKYTSYVGVISNLRSIKDLHVWFSTVPWYRSNNGEDIIVFLT